MSYRIDHARSIIENYTSPNSDLFIAIIGVLLLIFGVFISDIVRKFFITITRFFRIMSFFERFYFIRKSDTAVLFYIFSEYIRWFIIFSFLYFVFEMWKMEQSSFFIRQFFVHTPSIIIFFAILFFGWVFSNSVFKIVKVLLKKYEINSKIDLPIIAKGFVIFITMIVLTNYLGFTRYFIEILFAGFVFAISLSFGLAFGLAGKDIAGEIIKKIIEKINNKDK